MARSFGYPAAGFALALSLSFLLAPAKARGGDLAADFTAAKEFMAGSMAP